MGRIERKGNRINGLPGVLRDLAVLLVPYDGGIIQRNAMNAMHESEQSGAGLSGIFVVENSLAVA